MIDLHRVTTAYLNENATNRKPSGEGYASLEETLAFAASINQVQQFLQQIGYLANTAVTRGGDGKVMKTGSEYKMELYTDFAPWSFGWTLFFRKAATDEWKFSMNGGLIFHRDYANGEPTETGSWSIHT